MLFIYFKKKIVQNFVCTFSLLDFLFFVVEIFMSSLDLTIIYLENMSYLFVKDMTSSFNFGDKRLAMTRFQSAKKT